MGEEEKRYEVLLKYLALAAFQTLIKQSTRGDDLDTKVEGPITLPCTTARFDKFLKLAEKS